MYRNHMWYYNEYLAVYYYCYYYFLAFIAITAIHDVTVIQLREQGFRHIDALDPSQEMLDIAKKDGLYENYFCDFLTEKQLSIESSEY